MKNSAIKRTKNSLTYKIGYEIIQCYKKKHG